jgi:hypothetical protein
MVIYFTNISNSNMARYVEKEIELELGDLVEEYMPMTLSEELRLLHIEKREKVRRSSSIKMCNKYSVLREPKRSCQ